MLLVIVKVTVRESFGQKEYVDKVRSTSNKKYLKGWQDEDAFFIGVEGYVWQ
jgi:hypothetical protein